MCLLNQAIETELFYEIPKEIVSIILNYTEAEILIYKKGKIIERQEYFSKLGIVLSGVLAFAHNDQYGNRFILTTINKQEILSLSTAVCNFEFTNSYIYAISDCKLIMLDYSKLLNIYKINYSYRETILKNMLNIVNKQNSSLLIKQHHMSQKSIRRKLISYLSEQALKQNSLKFEIPMNRQELADFLGIDRSAMCAELSKMKKFGLIDYHKNNFQLKYNSLFVL